MTPEEFAEVFDEIAEAPEGIERLRELVLQLAVRGRLVPQDANEEPASVLLERIADEKFRLFREGKLRIPKPVPPIATDEAPFDVPDQWEWVRLGDIANSRLGKMLDKSKNKGPYRRYLRNANVQWFRFDLSDVLELRLEDAELEEYSVKENDLIVCEGGEPGRAAVCGPDVDGMVFQKALHRVRPWCGISTWYLAYLLRCDTWSQRINTLFTGATIKHLTGKALATHMVPLPPLSEQYRIVSKVDELMGLIDRLVAARRSREAVRTAARDSALAALSNAATPEDEQAAWTRIAERMDDLFTAPADLAPLREAVLQLAVRGRLVPQDADDESSSELLKRIAAEKARRDKRIKAKKALPTIQDNMLPFEIPVSWEWTHLGEITSYGATEKAEPGEVSEETWVLELEDIEKVSSRLLNRVRYGVRPFKSTKNRFYKGDILYGKLRPYLDKVVLADEGGVCSSEIMPVRGFVGLVPQFIRLVLKAPYFVQYANSSTHGMNLPRLGTDKARQALFPLPPEAEQHRIVAKVDELMELIDRLERHLGAKEEIQSDFATATNIV